MKKGLHLTLMTVAIALISVQAMAMAPTITDIPSPIIGSAEPVTGGSKYLMIDAFDIEALATDDATAPANLLWSYTGSASNGDSHYRINGVTPLNLSSDDPTSPSATKIINKNDLDTVTGKDGAPKTLTFRNQTLSPMGSGTNNDGSFANGIITAETQPVTFFCSDGNAFTSKTVFFYSDKGGTDRLSTSAAAWTKVIDQTFPAGQPMWTKNPLEWGIGSVTTSSWTGGGMCLNVPAAGDNYGSLISPMPYFQLAANQLYRIKLKVNGSQAAPGATPFWDFVLENYDANTSKGYNLYAMDTTFFDNVGGANSVVANNNQYLTLFWTPPAVSTAQWNAGAFTSGRDAQNDPRLRFRIMDVDSVAASQSQNKSGAVCIQQVLIESVPISSVKVQSNLQNIATLTQSNSGGTGNVQVNSFFAAGAVFANGYVTITPVGQGQSLEMADVIPASDLIFSSGPDTAWANYLDNWPIAWTTGKLIRVEAGLSAPTTADETNPWDAIFFTFQTMTNEINYASYITTNLGVAQPRVGTPQTYTAFFYTNKESVTAETRYHRLRWYVSFANHNAALFPTGQTTNTGAVRVHSIKVDVVDVQ